MGSRTRGSFAALLAAAALLLPAVQAAAPRHAAPPLPHPAGKDAPGLPPLPEVSPRNASYTIEARLDPDAHRITLMDSLRPLSELYEKLCREQ